MPDYSPVDEIDQTKPLDMSNIKYSAGEIFKAGLLSSYTNAMTNWEVKSLSKIKPNPAEPNTQPADQEFVNNLKKDRPGFNPPVGIPKFLALQLMDQYENNQYFEKVKSHPASIMGTVGAISGSFIGETADVKNLIYGTVGAGAAEKALAPIAESFITRLASKNLIGNGVAKIGTAISNSAISGSGFGFTAQVSAEEDKFEREELFNEPHNYIDALQNLGNATLYGAIAGIGFHAAGRVGAFGRDALIGKNVEITPESIVNVEPDENATTHGRYETPDEAQLAADLHQESTPVPHEYDINQSQAGDYVLTKRGKGGDFVKPATYERQGGLLQRLDLPNRTKEVLAKIYKPWTKAADDVTKTEAVGQMANGNLVDIEPVIKQGMYEEGVAFQDELFKAGIDREELDRQLAEAQENITSEMFIRHQWDSYVKKVTDKDFKAYKDNVTGNFNRLKVNDNFVDHPFYHGTGELSDISQFDITRAGLNSLYGEGLYITDSKLVASDYSKSRGGKKKNEFTGNIIEMNFKKNPKLIDINELPTNDVFKIVKEFADEEENLKIGDAFKDKTLDESIKLIRDEIYDQSGSEGVFIALNELNSRLEEAGYDGYLHTGGIATGQKINHNVAVLFGHSYIQDGKHFSKNPADILDQKSISMLKDYDKKLSDFKVLSGEIDEKIRKLEQDNKDWQRKWNDYRMKDKEKYRDEMANIKENKIKVNESKIKKLKKEKEINFIPDKPSTDLSIEDLAQQYEAAQQLRNSTKGEYEPLSQGEMEAYGQHLKESNMPPTGHSINAGENYKLDEQLAQYSDEDIKTLAEMTDKSKTGGKEIAESTEKLKNQDVYESMAQQITDCILKGGL